MMRGYDANHHIDSKKGNLGHNMNDIVTQAKAEFNRATERLSRALRDGLRTTKSTGRPR